MKNIINIFDRVIKLPYYAKDEAKGNITLYHYNNGILSSVFASRDFKTITNNIKEVDNIDTISSIFIDEYAITENDYVELAKKIIEFNMDMSLTLMQQQ